MIDVMIVATQPKQPPEPTDGSLVGSAPSSPAGPAEPGDLERRAAPPLARPHRGVLAGHETTANQLAWTWERLVRTPAAYPRGARIAQRVRPIGSGHGRAQPPLPA